MKKPLLTFILILVTSCATVYQGAKPNFNLKGSSAAKEEIKKYRLSDSIWTAGTYFKFEGSDEIYTIDSMIPLISSVSPEAVNRISGARAWFLAQNILAVVAVGSLVALIADANSTRGWSYPLVFGASGGSILCGFIGAFRMKAVATEYNESLQQRLTQHSLFPNIALGLSF